MGCGKEEGGEMKNAVGGGGERRVVGVGAGGGAAELAGCWDVEGRKVAR